VNDAGTTFAVERLAHLPPDRLAELVGESERQGWRFVRRLVEEWDVGVTRFDRPGEALFAARANGRVVGICGLSVDPYAGDPRVGRVRHLYVLTAWRRRGLARGLVEAVVAAAGGTFDRLRLRTANPAAARLYEALGFRPCAGVPDCTHALGLRM
jgi:ribosomal protein S18 acetylase RimI-like enzyme